MRRSRPARIVQSLVAFALSLAGVAVVAEMTGARWGLYGVFGLGYLSMKLLLATAYRAFRHPVPDLSVAVVVPVYNEDPAAFAGCLDSILAQSVPVDEIWVIDDGSTDTTCVEFAARVLEGRPGAVVHAMPRNVGKRHAQEWALRQTRAAIVCTVDSDTKLDADAVREGLRPFADTRVTAVCGNVRVLNAATNLLTRLTELRYANAFLWERAAYSTLGSVVCCCGSLSFWRRDVIDENLDDYVNQTFLGVPVPYGDDRRLTNYSLLAGRVVFQSTSIAWTAVPERFSHFVRQQTRWNRSFFRESLWAIKNHGRLQAVWWLTGAEIGLWSACLVSAVAAHAVRPAMTGRFAVGILAFGVLMAYARSVRYLGSEDRSVRHQLHTFALAPLYTLLSLLVLFPLRLIALATLRSESWGTRSEVEVTMDAHATLAGAGAGV